MEIKLIEDGYLTTAGSILMFLVMGMIIVPFVWWCCTYNKNKQGVKDVEYKSIIYKPLKKDFDVLIDYIKSTLKILNFEFINTYQYSKDCVAYTFIQKRMKS